MTGINPLQKRKVRRLASIEYNGLKYRIPKGKNAQEVRRQLGEADAEFAPLARHMEKNISRFSLQDINYARNLLLMRRNLIKPRQLREGEMGPIRNLFLHVQPSVMEAVLGKKPIAKADLNYSGADPRKLKNLEKSGVVCHVDRETGIPMFSTSRVMLNAKDKVFEKKSTQGIFEGLWLGYDIANIISFDKHNKRIEKIKSLRDEAIEKNADFEKLDKIMKEICNARPREPKTTYLRGANFDEFERLELSGIEKLKKLIRETGH